MVSPVEGLQRDSQFDPERRDPLAGETAGDLLRRTREAYGQDIDTVAKQLRIRDSYLRAIEAGRFGELPGTTYAVGFVRSYAEYLRLDAQEILRRFREEVAEVNGQTQLIFPAAATEGKFPGGAILLLSVLLAGVAYGAWYYLSDQRANMLDLIPAVPEQIRDLVSGEVAPADSTGDAVTPSAGDDNGNDPEARTVTETDEVEAVAEAGETETRGNVAEADAPVAEEAPPSPQPAMQAQAGVALPAPESGPDDAEAETTVAAIPAAPAVPTAEPDPQVFGSANAGFRIMLRARLESWVQVTDADDRILLTRVLRAGDSYQVPDRPGLMLATGNAGGLDIIVDGREVQPLGAVGVVRRDIPLDPEQLAGRTTLRR